MDLCNLFCLSDWLAGLFVCFFFVLEHGYRLSCSLRNGREHGLVVEIQLETILFLKGENALTLAIIFFVKEREGERKQWMDVARGSTCCYFVSVLEDCISFKRMLINCLESVTVRYPKRLLKMSPSLK